MSDGSLWQWSRTFSWVHPFAQAMSGVAGLAIGLASGAFIVKLRRALRET